MNDKDSFQQQMYENLENLVRGSETFTSKDFFIDNLVYRIFNYRLSNWSEFQLPDALNARGVMFNISDRSKPVLVSLPPKKFFNYEEGGVQHVLCKIGDQMVKMDGSLISTYMHDGEMYLKSKASLDSDQAIWAMNFLNNEVNIGLKKEMESLVKKGYTVNMEYTSPQNRVVVKYDNEKLTLLNIRCHKSGKTLFGTKLKEFLLKNHLASLTNILVENVDLSKTNVNQDEYLNRVRNETEGEGYVVEMIPNTGEESYLVKIKTIKYLTLHQTKEAICSDRKLFEAIIEETTDDLRSLFLDDGFMLNRINSMEARIQPIFNHMVATVESFVDKNKKLDRKSFALLGQKEQPQFFGLCMQLYLGKQVNFKEFAKKGRKDVFGVDDVVLDLDSTRNNKPSVQGFVKSPI